MQKDIHITILMTVCRSYCAHTSYNTCEHSQYTMLSLQQAKGLHRHNYVSKTHITMFVQCTILKNQNTVIPREVPPCHVHQDYQYMLLKVLPCQVYQVTGMCFFQFCLVRYIQITGTCFFQFCLVRYGRLQVRASLSSALSGTSRLPVHI